MGTVLGTLAELGYGFAYRVLDAQFFGVPQRRRRIIFVGRLGDGAAPVQVLLEPESGAGNSAAGRSAGQGIAATLTSGVSGAGISAPGRRQEDDTNLVTGTLTAGMLGDYDDNTARQGFMVAHTTGAGWWNEGAGTLRAQGGGTDQGGHLVVGALMAGSPTSYRIGPDEAAVNQLVAFSHTAGIDLQASEDIAPTIKAGHDTMPAVAVPVDLRNGADTGDIAMSLQAGGMGDGRGRSINSLPHLTSGAAVRRLTPVECERLQGFPDNWTAISSGKPQSDSARYRQLGNAVAVPCIEWVARRLVATDEHMREDGAA